MTKHLCKGPSRNSRPNTLSDTFNVAFSFCVFKHIFLWTTSFLFSFPVHTFEFVSYFFFFFFRGKTCDFQTFRSLLVYLGNASEESAFTFASPSISEYPVLHDPLVLLHTALALQLWVSVVENSSKSEIFIKDVQ